MERGKRSERTEGAAARRLAGLGDARWWWASVREGSLPACSEYPLAGPITTVAGVFQTLTRTPTTQPRIASNQAAPLNHARLLLASLSTFLNMQAGQAVSARASSVMDGILPLMDEPSNYTVLNRPPSVSLCM